AAAHHVLLRATGGCL
ncbi:putative Calpain small subunit 1 protein, partial [Naja naja]